MKNRGLLFSLLLTSLVSASAVAETREYRVYRAAGTYGLAWGCQGMPVDFERMDADDDFAETVFEKCKIRNVLVNLLENRIVKDLQDDDHFVLRPRESRHHSRDIGFLGWIAGRPDESTLLYTLSEDWKWQGADNLFIAVQDGRRPEKVVMCDSCDKQAETAVFQKLGWMGQIDQYALTTRFTNVTGPTTADNRLLVTIEGVVPKDEGYFSVEAVVKLEVAANHAISLQLEKIVKVDKE